MNEVFIGGETVHHRATAPVIAFHSECDFAFGRGGGTYAS
jgi:hypothetical protein